VKSVSSSFIIVFLLLLPVVLAQTELISRGLLRSVLGPLPQACSVTLNSSDCIACLGTAKMLPFAFFFGLVYFAMVFLVFRILGGLPRGREGPQTLDIKAVTPSFHFAAILISLVLALMLLHFREVSMLFLSIGQLQQILILAFSIVIVISFLYAIHPLSPMLGLFVLVFSIGIVWTFYNTLASGGLFNLPTPEITSNPCFITE